MPIGDPAWLQLTPETVLEQEIPICDAHHHIWAQRHEPPAYQRYLLPDLAADIHKMADDRGPVADLHIGVRQLPRTDAFDEIAHVRRAFARPFFRGFRRSLVEFGAVGLKTAAQDLHLPISALKDGTQLLVIVDLGLLK